MGKCLLFGDLFAFGVYKFEHAYIRPILVEYQRNVHAIYVTGIWASVGVVWSQTAGVRGRHRRGRNWRFVRGIFSQLFTISAKTKTLIKFPIKTKTFWTQSTQ